MHFKPSIFVTTLSSLKLGSSVAPHTYRVSTQRPILSPFFPRVHVFYLTNTGHHCVRSQGRLANCQEELGPDGARVLCAGHVLHTRGSPPGDNNNQCVRHSSHRLQGILCPGVPPVCGCEIEFKVADLVDSAEVVRVCLFVRLVLFLLRCSFPCWCLWFHSITRPVQGSKRSHCGIWSVLIGWAYSYGFND